VDEDGFQQVRHRKTTRKNIFDIVNDDMRSNTFALGEEIRATRYTALQKEVGHTTEG
jgi:hypothetical protein